MKQYDANNILNVALAGHSGAGKTSLTEAMLYLAKATERIFLPLLQQIRRMVSTTTGCILTET